MLERGLRIPTLSTLFQISKALKRTPSELIKIIEERYKAIQHND
jgi:transcriptional regulator with XRE-family HTH domain